MMTVTALSRLKQHVSTTSGVCGGKPCITGTRIRVWDIAVLAQSGNSPDEILAHYPHLTLSDVHAALSYYYDNRKAIDRQMAQDERLAKKLKRKLGQGPLQKKRSTAPSPSRT
jgi:uncharacterized protein (DUF433 family)